MQIGTENSTNGADLLKWLDQKSNWLPRYADGKHKYQEVFSVSEVAAILAVTPQTVKKWIICDIITENDWFKLPNGYIRITKKAVDRLRKVKK